VACVQDAVGGRAAAEGHCARGVVAGRGAAGPAGFDAADYKGRNAVERRFNRYTQWRGLASRYGHP